MLISFSCENILSFKQEQSISLVATNKQKDNIIESNIIKTKNNGNLLKSAIIFGANGSGKTNLLAALFDLHSIVVDSLKNLEFADVGNTSPFLLDPLSENNNSEYEIEFQTSDTKTYRYGLSFKNDIIDEEWLFYTHKKQEEILLFHRKKNKMSLLNENFNEANNFIQNKKILQTKKNIPFISVLSSFNGEHSSEILKWFSSIHFFESDHMQKDLERTLRLWKNNSDFRQWAAPLLNSIGIQNISFEEEIQPSLEILKQKILKDKNKIREIQLSEDNNIMKEKAMNLFDGLIDFISSSPNVNQQKLEQQKKINLSTVQLIRVIDEETFGLPFSVESQGTKKLLSLLGVMYQVITNGGILIDDEFDVGFHTLLSKYIFKIFHKNNIQGQLLVTAHDTALMDTEYFRRDQIWLMNKNARGESELYSLVEFQELADNIINRQYSNDYLNGFYEAIPLFDNIDTVEELMNDKK